MQQKSIAQKHTKHLLIIKYIRKKVIKVSEKKKYYLTTAIAYTSGKPHIGNTYEIVLADAIARFKRFQGFDVRFQTGTDEHGQKIELKANEAGITPKEFVDNVSTEIKRIWDLMNTSYDKFIRTTDDYHERQIQKFFKKLYDQGDIYKGFYEGMYCTPCESFFTESQLVDGKCPDCGRPVSPMKEEAYFLKLSKYADRLIEHIETHPDFIQPESRKHEMINNFLKPGLQDLCVSRTSFKWGIPVDFDDRHVVYVWMDALSNYVTGLGFDLDGNNTLSADGTDLYEKFWPADLHLIGKDILRFHTIYWPIMLMALGLPLPKQVFGHPWLLQNDGKMSKSKGNVIYADDLVDIFGVDAVRYFVLHEMPFENDGIISWDLVCERTNSDLANTLGNLVNRVISMTNKYLDGVAVDKGVAEDVDASLKEFVLGTPAKVVEKMDKLRVADAMTEIFNLFKRCNKYIDETEPWVLGKDESKKDRLSTVLYNLIEGITIGASLLKSFMPETADKIFAQLNSTERSFEDMDKFGLYPEGNRVTEKPEILFARLDFEDVKAKVEEKYPPVPETEEDNSEEAKADEKVIDIPKKEEITIDDFFKCQFQVGEILECKAVEKSKKLLCSQVKIGSEVKQIVSGIRKYYSPEEMVGKKVMVVVNLKPAKLAGILSEGMILCAEDADGNLSLMVPEKSMPAGAEIC
ncbi:MAG: methionine--tRNA ligase [Lachnospiraceae bacterium]|nr:methionine--tRNA ligase [Lachnospiraceae bacterium]